MDELSLLAAISLNHQIVGAGECRCGYTYCDEQLYVQHVEAEMIDAGIEPSCVTSR